MLGELARILLSRRLRGRYTRATYMAEEQAIAYEILSYLNKHKEAQDTLEGIAQWWLLQQTIEQHLLRVKKALNILVEKNLILIHEGKGTGTRYGINPQKSKEISELLDGKSSP